MLRLPILPRRRRGLRYAVMSDVHANLPALRAALSQIEERGVDRFLCLGDIVGYGAWPNECCDLLRELDCVCVRGNHDEAAVSPGKERWFTAGARACIVWTREGLSDANRRFLEQLEPRAELDGITLCHGSVPEQDFYTTTPLEAMYSLEATRTALTFLGHTHYAEWYALASGDTLPRHTPLPQGGQVCASPHGKLLINPGSVGQPRDGTPQPAFAILDVEATLVEIVRFDYEIAEAQQGILSAGLPRQMAERLAWGI